MLKNLFLASGFLLLSLLTINVAEAEQPNILFIFADDQSYETIHELGNTEIQTPSLDRLCQEGYTFTHAYNMGSWSGAVCIASRTMLNSGRFVWRAKAIHGKSKQEQQAGRWWSEHMKSAGYKTYFTGKWHCKAPAEDSFDVTSHIRGGMPAQTPEGYNRPQADGSDTWSPSDPKFGGFWEGGKHWSEVVGDDAIDFLKDAKKQESPFFMYVAFNAPHDPRQSPQEYVDRYPLEKIATPKNFLPLYPHKDKIRLGPSLRDEKLATFPRTEYGVKVNRQEYYAIITHMDDQIKRILAQLDASGLRENTWIFFTADHGLACGHHGLMGKQNMYDHSLRVPFMVVPPTGSSQSAPGKRIAEPIYLQDVMATSLELAGVEKPEHVEFNSVLPLLSGGKSPYESIYGAYLEVQRCIRTEDYKLILYPEAKVKRLFRVKDDPDEMIDLAEKPGSLPIMKKLFAEFLQHQEMQEDELDVKGAFPELL
ncbi:MAG: sulfatase-like hydrolase/transferase [Planctomycetota bacterium]